MVNEDPKFEDIDPSFLSFIPSFKLPSDIIKCLQFHYNREKNAYITYQKTGTSLDSKLFEVYWGTKFLKVFSQDCEDVWCFFYANNKEATIQLAKYIGNMGNFLSMSRFMVENSAKQLEHIQSLKKVFADCLIYLKCYGGELTDDGGWDYFEEKTRNLCIRYDMHTELQEAIEGYLERLSFIESHRTSEEIALGNKAAYPLSRKRNVENAEAVFFIKILNKKFLFFFNKPHHDHVATFINAVFGTCYDYTAIAQIVRKR